MGADGFLLGEAPLFSVFIAGCIQTLCALAPSSLTLTAEWPRAGCPVSLPLVQVTPLEHLEDRARLQAQAWLCRHARSQFLTE